MCFPGTWSGCWRKNQAALGELLIVGILLFALCRFSGVSRRRLFGGTVLVLLGELYLHQMLLPFWHPSFMPVSCFFCSCCSSEN